MNNLTLDFSYHLRFNESDHRLAMGVKAGGNYTTLDLANLTLDNSNDPAFDLNYWKVYAELWLVYYYTPKWYVGFSSPHLVNYDFNSTQRHYFIIGGAIFELNEEMKLRPSTYLKLTQNAPITMDLTALLIIRDRIWVGGHSGHQ